MKDVGGGGRGTRRQVNKSAICKRVCLTSSEPNSVIGLPSVGGVEGGGASIAAVDPPLWRTLACLQSEQGTPTRPPGAM